MKNEFTERNKRYLEYVEIKSPKTSPWKSLFFAFLIGGLICCMSQAFADVLPLIFKGMAEEDAKTWALVITVTLAVLLTAIGVFDDIGHIGGAGTFLPITGFANSIASPAIEYKAEGLTFGVGAKMFYVAGPVIVNGVVYSIIGALLNYLIYGVIFK